MKSDKSFWDKHSSWEEADNEWRKGANKLALLKPLKTPPHLPSIPGITKDTAKYLKWKSLSYLVRHDKTRVIPRYFFKKPLKYGWSLLKSCLKKKSFIRDDDFFLYGIKDTEEFKELLQDPKSLLVMGFSYCHKPFECPSKRFSDQCIHDPNHPVCRQCFIGQAVNALPQGRAITLFIPTIHYIGEKIFEIVHAHPERRVIFLITACELTLEMFGDWGNMVGIQGVGVRLDGRICNTMKAFELSEEGIKPGLTIVANHTQERILTLIKFFRSQQI